MACYTGMPAYTMKTRTLIMWLIHTPLMFFELILLYFFQKFSRLLLMQLAFQSLGVVYGDLGTSPLYVFYNTFPDGIEDPEDLIGALSLIIYSLTLIPLLKYVLIVCRANDNGQGKPLTCFYWDSIIAVKGDEKICLQYNTNISTACNGRIFLELWILLWSQFLYIVEMIINKNKSTFIWCISLFSWSSVDPLPPL